MRQIKEQSRTLDVQNSRYRHENISKHTVSGKRTHAVECYVPQNIRGLTGFPSPWPLEIYSQYGRPIIQMYKLTVQLFCSTSFKWLTKVLTNEAPESAAPLLISCPSSSCSLGFSHNVLLNVFETWTSGPLHVLLMCLERASPRYSQRYAHSVTFFKSWLRKCAFSARPSLATMFKIANALIPCISYYPFSS